MAAPVRYRGLMRLAMLALPALLGAAPVAGCGDLDNRPDDAGPPNNSDLSVPLDLAEAPPDLRPARDFIPPPPDLVPPRFRFAAPTTVTVGAQPLQILLVDLDGSGTLDLVTANYGDPGDPKKFPS